MTPKILTELIKNKFESLPLQVRKAARFVLEHPQEVAIMSMREQARQAGVPASTMTRLAKQVGLVGYDEIREVFINSIRNKENEYSSRVSALVKMKDEVGENYLVVDLAQTTVSHVESLCNENNINSIVAAARTLSTARNIYCLGLRASFPVALHFFHIVSYFQSNIHLIEGSGESGLMLLLQKMGPKDVLLVCSLSPHARQSVTLTRYLHQQKIKIVSISDNASSPIARIASNSILVNKQTTSFFDTLTPAFLVSELLGTLLATMSKLDVRESVAKTEKKLWKIGEWWDLD